MSKHKVQLIPGTHAPETSRWSENSIRIASLFGVILLLIPVTIYCVIVVKNAYNFPYEDDFNSALSFVSDFVFKKTQVDQRIQLLFSQYNEHRIAFDRLVFLGNYYLLGSLNFRYLILCGNVAVLLLAFLFLKLSFQAFPWRQRVLYLIPVAYSLFLFQYWELSTWAMAALSNFYAIVFALFSLYQLTKPGKYSLLLACVAASLATFTIGSGVFCFIAGIPLLILRQNYRRLVVWISVGAANILYYFNDYYRPPYHPDILDTLLNHTGQAIRYFFSLLGIFFPSRPTVSLLFGVIMFLTAILVVLYRWRTRRLAENLPMLGFLLYLYLVCLSITAGRSGFGVAQAYSTRYGFIIVTLYATQAVLTIETIRHYRLRTGVAVGYGLLAIFWFASGTNMRNRRNIEQRSARLQELAQQYRKNPDTIKLPWGDPTQAKAIFDDALAKGIYRLDEE